MGARDIGWRPVLVAVGAVLSGIFAALAFAPFGMADAAWCALVPVLIASAYVSPAWTWRMGWCSGTIFWLITMFWLTRITYTGWFLLCLYCGLYMIPPVLFSARWFRTFGVQHFRYNALYLVLITAVWVSAEYLRLTLFTGFPWNPLGAALYRNAAFIQHASWGGVYAPGALLVLTNAALVVTALRYMHKQARFGRKPHPELMLGMSAVVVAFIIGGNMAREIPFSSDTCRIALIQPAIPQEEKWSEENIELIYRRLDALTRQAVTFTQPDLVVWPETALPDDVRLSAPSYELVDTLSRLGSPILAGSMDAEYIIDQRPRFFNCSFLFDTNGMIVGEYAKQHLVLLGEYIPFHETLPFMRALTPNMESFTAGTTATVMRLPGRDVSFSPLICFEDSFPYLARKAVRNGARLLVNQTNDAWFDPSAASLQHLALCVFRAVENRVTVVRSANTGYTCAIDARGRISDQPGGAEAAHDAAGFQLVEVDLPPPHMTPTFYTRHGDVFAWGCLVLGVMGFAVSGPKQKKAA